MNRVAPLFVGVLLSVPMLAQAQVLPVPPPPPPAPAAPATPAAPARPMPAPSPVFIDHQTIQDAVLAAQTVHIDGDMLRDQIRLATDQARLAADTIRLSDFHFANDFRFDQNAQTYVYNSGQSNEGSSYNSALSLMSERKYEEAIARFDRVIQLKGAHADGAMYHKAFCQAKVGRSADATMTLADLRKTYPQSAYLQDARALEVDVRQLGPNQVDDEDLKIMAIQSLQFQSPDQAIPLLEGVLTKSTNSLRYKRQALIVLAQIDQPRARTILLSYAKGSGNPDLQKRAIELLGQRGQKTTSAELIDIYNSTKDYEVRSSVITAFRNAGAKNPLMAIAGGSTTLTGGGFGANAVVSPDPANAAQMANLRSRAIQSLTELASPQELFPLYQKEDNKDLRLQWVGVFSSMGAVDQLMQIINTEKEPSVKNRAVSALGNVKADKTGTTLVNVYGSGDRDTKMAVIRALGNQNNAEGMIAVFGKETEPTLQREMVSKLAEMAKTSKVAMDFLVNLVKK